MSVKVQPAISDASTQALVAPAGVAVLRSYLFAYLNQLQTHPLRTKMTTSATLSGLQEITATYLAGESKNGHYFTSRVPKMACYGGFIGAPLGHTLVSILQWLFAGRTSLSARILQIIVSNLVVAPIQNTVYLSAMAVIAGARSFNQIAATVRAGILPVMKVAWCTMPASLAFAQQFLPQETWVPFFNLVGFCIGTYINTTTKRRRARLLREEKIAAEKKCG